METKLTPEQEALETKLFDIFSDAELLRGMKTPDANQVAIVNHLLSNRYTMAQAEVAHRYILHKDFEKREFGRGIEKQDFYPTEKELQEMQKSGDLYFCPRSHQEQILKEVYKSARRDAGIQEYERGKRDGIKQACEATPELKELYKSSMDEKLLRMKMLNEGLQSALDEALDTHNEQQSTIKSLHKQIESLRNALGALASHTETYFSEKATSEERFNAKEEVQNDIAKANRLLWGDEPRRTTAIAPVNEETGAFDDLPPVEYTKKAPEEYAQIYNAPLLGTLGSILANVQLQSLNPENQERISKARALQNRHAQEYEREAA